MSAGAPLLLPLASALVIAAGPAAPRPAQPPGLIPGTPCSTGFKACVSLGEQRAWLTDGTKVAHGGIAFHEGTFDRASAGCVRLVRADAERYFTTLQVGERSRCAAVEANRRRTGSPADRVARQDDAWLASDAALYVTG